MMVPTIQMVVITPAIVRRILPLRLWYFLLGLIFIVFLGLFTKERLELFGQAFTFFDYVFLGAGV